MIVHFQQAQSVNLPNKPPQDMELIENFGPIIGLLSAAILGLLLTIYFVVLSEKRKKQG